MLPAFWISVCMLLIVVALALLWFWCRCDYKAQRGERGKDIYGDSLAIAHHLILTAEAKRWKSVGVDIWKTMAATSATDALTSAAPCAMGAADYVGERQPLHRPTTTDIDLSHVDRLTLSKTMQTLDSHPDACITGFVIDLGYDGASHAIVDHAIVERSSVRWLRTKELWDLMHPPAPRAHAASAGPLSAETRFDDAP